MSDDWREFKSHPAPTDGTPFLVGWANRKWDPAVAHIDDDSGKPVYFTGRGLGFAYFTEEPTHWRPLPQPPKAKPCG